MPVLNLGVYILLFTFPSANILIVHIIFQMQRASHPFLADNLPNPNLFSTLIFPPSMLSSSRKKSLKMQMGKWKDWKNDGRISNEAGLARKRIVGGKSIINGPIWVLIAPSTIFLSTKDKEKNFPSSLETLSSLRSFGISGRKLF